MALGADPGPGEPDTRDRGSGCTHGTMPGMVMVMWLRLVKPTTTTSGERSRAKPSTSRASVRGIRRQFGQRQACGFTKVTAGSCQRHGGLNRTSAHRHGHHAGHNGGQPNLSERAIITQL